MRKLLMAGVMTLAMAGAAVAKDSPKWSQVGPWSIFVDQSVGNGCFMSSGYSGTFLRVGFNNTEHSSYFLIGNAAWQSLEAGKQYEVTGQFDDGVLAHWNAYAVNFGGATFLRVSFNSPSPTEVMTVFGQRLNLKLFYHGRILANLNLNGTAAAAAETINCNRQLTPDPFGGEAPPVITDPFHQS